MTKNQIKPFQNNDYKVESRDKFWLYLAISAFLTFVNLVLSYFKLTKIKKADTPYSKYPPFLYRMNYLNLISGNLFSDFIQR